MKKIFFIAMVCFFVAMMLSAQDGQGVQKETVSFVNGIGLWMVAPDGTERFAWETLVFWATSLMLGLVFIKLFQIIWEMMNAVITTIRKKHHSPFGGIIMSSILSACLLVEIAACFIMGAMGAGIAISFTHGTMTFPDAILIILVVALLIPWIFHDVVPFADTFFVCLALIGIGWFIGILMSTGLWMPLMAAGACFVGGFFYDIIRKELRGDLSLA